MASIFQTQGIVLRAIKYEEHSLIAVIYTLDFGIRSFIVPGAFSRRGNKHVHFHVLSLIEFTFYHKPNNDLHKLTEVHFDCIFKYLHTHPIKTAYAYMIAEVLQKTIREEIPNPSLFSFIHSYLLYFDEVAEHLYQVIIAFLLRLTYYLGIGPIFEQNMEQEKLFFDLENGLFTTTVETARQNNTDFLCYQFASLSRIEDAHTLTVPKQERWALLMMILSYYHLHFDGFANLKSISMLEEIFG